MQATVTHAFAASAPDLKKALAEMLQDAPHNFPDRALKLGDTFEVNIDRPNSEIVIDAAGNIFLIIIA